MALYKFRLGIMLTLIDLGVKVYAISPTDIYSDKLKAKGIKFIPLEMIPHKTNPFSDLKYLWDLLMIYKRIQPDLIFHYTIKPNIYGSIAARLLSIPSFSIVPGRGHAFNKRNWLYFLVKKLYTYSIAHSVSTWFLNSEDRDFFVKEGIVPKNKTLLKPGEGVDTSFYRPSPNRTFSPSNKTKFILSSRLLWEKGIGEYVAAARIVKKSFPETKFYLMGFLDTSDHRVVPKEEVEKWEKEGLVQYLGQHEDVRPFLDGVDCFVLPSYYGEGLPRSIMEAASMAVPIITTDHRGCRRAVEDKKTGLLCSPKSSEQLANLMIDFIGYSNERKVKMGNLGRDLMKNKFEESIVVGIYMREIRKRLNVKRLVYEEMVLN